MYDDERRKYYMVIWLSYPMSDSCFFLLILVIIPWELDIGLDIEDPEPLFLLLGLEWGSVFTGVQSTRYC